MAGRDEDAENSPGIGAEIGVILPDTSEGALAAAERLRRKYRQLRSLSAAHPVTSESVGVSVAKSLFTSSEQTSDYTRPTKTVAIRDRLGSTEVAA